MRKLLINEVIRFKNEFPVKQRVFDKFINFIKTGKKLVKKEGTNIHLGTFFLPINKKSRSIYLVNHIKAKMWIPPGGHVEKNELPIETVRREFFEELNYPLTIEKIELFNLSITPINRPWENCVTHYDFWYSVEVEKIPFKFLKKEFYYGDWFDFDIGIKKIRRKPYQNILKNLIKKL